MYYYAVFDDNIHTNGLQEQVVDLLTKWVDAQKAFVPGMKWEVVKEPNRTPVIFIEIEATKPDAGTILLYGYVVFNNKEVISSSFCCLPFYYCIFLFFILHLLYLNKRNNNIQSL